MSILFHSMHVLNDSTYKVQQLLPKEIKHENEITLKAQTKIHRQKQLLWAQI